MAEPLSYLIIGNGIAGATAAEILRTEDSAADITVIGDDPFPVYYRPALKDYLGGRVREDKLWARSTSFYLDRRIRFLTDSVVGIQVAQHTVQLRSGHSIGYTRLLLAQGARAATLECSGVDLVGVTTLRTVADYQKVLARLTSVRRIVVTGSGPLALETAETLRHRGFQVTHLLRGRTLRSEALDAPASDLVLQQEKRDGVDVRIEQEIVEITGKGSQVTGVLTTTGVHIPCEMVILGIGIEPIIDFVKPAGIICGRGVKVDCMMRTSAPDIYAAGDLIETTDPITGHTRVIGQWYPSIQQARAAAYSMLNLLEGKHQFRFGNFINATFLYGLDFASVGLSNVPTNGQGYQEIVADPRPRTYQKVVLKDGIPVGMLALGQRSSALPFKRAIDHAVNLAPVASRLFDSDFKLTSWLDSQGVPPPILGVTREGAMAVKQVANAGASIIPRQHKPDLHPETPPAPLESVSQHKSETLDPTVVLKTNSTSHASSPASSSQPFLNADGSLTVPGATHTIPAPMLVMLQERSALIAVVQSYTQVFPLKQGKRYLLGRDKDNDIPLSDLSISRKHAETFPGPDGFYIRDLGSSNGVLVNYTRIDNPYHLSNGDCITVGNINIYFFEPGVHRDQPQLSPAREAEQVKVSRAGTPSRTLKLVNISAARSKTCRNCGTTSSPIARFCPACGASLQEVQ